MIHQSRLYLELNCRNPYTWVSQTGGPWTTGVCGDYTGGPWRCDKYKKAEHAHFAVCRLLQV